MGPVQETIYGRTWFVEAKAKSENLAYTPAPIPLHADLMYLQAAPGVQFLHCISQAGVGGDNYFVDGFHVISFPSALLSFRRSYNRRPGC